MKRTIAPTTLAIVFAAVFGPGIVPDLEAQAGAEGWSADVKMRFSGTMTATTLNLEPDSITDEADLAGDGSLGPFTFRELHADTLVPQTDPPSSCLPPLGFIPVVRGGGVLRFQDGSLLVVNLTGGSLCIDFAAGVAQLTETYTIARGTKRFMRATGDLTLTAMVSPVFASAAGAPQLLTSTGTIEGTVLREGSLEGWVRRAIAPTPQG